MVFWHRLLKVQQKYYLSITRNMRTIFFCELKLFGKLLEQESHKTEYNIVFLLFLFYFVHNFVYSIFKKKQTFDYPMCRCIQHLTFRTNYKLFYPISQWVFILYNMQKDISSRYKVSKTYLNFSLNNIFYHDFEHFFEILRKHFWFLAKIKVENDSNLFALYCEENFQNCFIHVCKCNTSK